MEVSAVQAEGELVKGAPTAPVPALTSHHVHSGIIRVFECACEFVMAAVDGGSSHASIDVLPMDADEQCLVLAHDGHGLNPHALDVDSDTLIATFVRRLVRDLGLSVTVLSRSAEHSGMMAAFCTRAGGNECFEVGNDPSWNAPQALQSAVVASPVGDMHTLLAAMERVGAHGVLAIVSDGTRTDVPLIKHLDLATEDDVCPPAVAGSSLHAMCLAAWRTSLRLRLQALLSCRIAMGLTLRGKEVWPPSQKLPATPGMEAHLSVLRALLDGEASPLGEDAPSEEAPEHEGEAAPSKEPDTGPPGPERPALPTHAERVDANTAGPLGQAAVEAGDAAAAPETAVERGAAEWG